MGKARAAEKPAGPWKVSGPKSDGGWYAVRGDHSPLRRGPYSFKDSAARRVRDLNADYFARMAAPELLAALRNLLGVFPPVRTILEQDACKAAAAAIEKAQGLDRYQSDERAPQ
jgi:hypothetical protein